jgi:hypothetical protein
MEVWNFQIESLAASEPDTPHPSSDVADAQSTVLENQKLREVEFLDILHFKRVVRRPLSDIRVLPKQPNTSVVTQRSEDNNAHIEAHIPKESEQLLGKDLPQISAPQPRRGSNGRSVEGRFGTNLTPSTGPKPAAKGTDPSSVEIFKSFRVSMEDPCYKVLPAALNKYNINAPWEQYALYIVYGDKERCLGLEEKPLIIFKQMDKEGLKPMFMLRKLPTVPPPKPEADDHDDISSLSHLNSEVSPSDSRVEPWLAQSQEEIFEKPKTPHPLPARLRRPQRSPKAATGTKVETSRIDIRTTDSCSQIIPIALKSHCINKPWLFYNLFIVYEDQEHLVSLEEEPVFLFRQLVLEGKDPVFILRKKYAHDETAALKFVPERVKVWEAMRMLEKSSNDEFESRRLSRRDGESKMPLSSSLHYTGMAIH